MIIVIVWSVGNLPEHMKFDLYKENIKHPGKL